MDAEIQTKITEMGKAWEDFKSHHELLKNDVKGLQDKSPILDDHIRKVSDAVAKCHEELTLKFNEIATKLNRINLEDDSNTDTDEKKADYKEAKEMAKLALSRKGRLHIGEELTEDQINDFKGYGKGFISHIRYGRDKEHMYSDADRKALSVGSDLDGGFFIRPVWSNRIITKIFETSPIRQLATVDTVTGPELKYPVDISEANCGWTGETQSRATTSTPVVNEKSIIAQELYALPKATQSLLEDAGIDVEAWLMDKVASKMARVEATAFVLGNGIAMPRGLWTYPNGLNWGQVQQVGSGSSGAFTLTGLTNIVGQLKEPYHPGARWLMQRASVPAIMLLTDGNGRYVFQPIFSMGYNNAPLLGYPITYAADVPSIGAGALAAGFGDFKEAYTILDRLGISLLRDPYLYKPFVGFYTRKRVGGDVLNFEAYKLQVLT
jgi:HK97 family phage major capsid protein